MPLVITPVTKPGRTRITRTPVPCSESARPRAKASSPDLVRAQVEGGLIWALGAAAWGEVVLGDGGQIITQNFDTYPVMRMKSVPQIDVLLIESAEPPTGVGEVSVPTAAPALTGAIAALTGTRIRRLPITRTMKIL